MKKQRPIGAAGNTLFIRYGTAYTTAHAMSLADISVIPAGMATASSVTERLAMGPAAGSTSMSYATAEVVINYQRTYWEVGMELLRKARTERHRADIMDAAITNLYIGLIKLFGMHWKPEDKQRYNQERERIHRERFNGITVDAEAQDAFDAEYPPTASDYTFSLYVMVKVAFVLAKGWNLEEVDGGSLMERFRRLNSYFTDLSRHFEEKKANKAISLAFSDLDAYANTVIEIVRWFMLKFYGTVPDHAKAQFHEVFGTPY